MGKKHVIPQLIKKIKNTKLNGKLELYSPDHTRTFCFIKYAVEKILHLIERDKWDINTLNLGVDGPEIKIRELAKIILHIMNRKDISLKELENTQGSPSRRVPDTTKLNQETKPIRIPSLNEGITETYNWYIKSL